MKEAFIKYIYESNREGSHKAGSYIKALEYLSAILKKPSLMYSHPVNFWEIDSPEKIKELYLYALENQKKEGSEFFLPGKRSYAEKGYFSAALKSYLEFLIQFKHETVLWNIVDKLEEGESVAKQIEPVSLKNSELLIPQKMDFKSKEGKDVLRQVKTRANQEFFSKMIRRIYRDQCAVCGLNIPEVLRASHIIPWSKDKKNRLNPCNGLCLSATYDAAFDRHLISFDEDYRMIFSPKLKAYYTNKAFEKYFKCFEGAKLSLPYLFLPNQNFLDKHRQKLNN